MIKIKRSFLWFIFIGVLISPQAFCEQEVGLDLAPKLNVGLAERAANACIEYVNKPDGPMIAVGVFDPSGELLAFKRKDNMSPGIIDVALSKGRAAARYGFSTREMGSWAKNNAAVVILPSFNGSTGGLPIKTQSGIVVGGIGVSGSSSDDDEKCAQAGIAAISHALSKY